MKIILIIVLAAGATDGGVHTQKIEGFTTIENCRKSARDFEESKERTRSYAFCVEVK